MIFLARLLFRDIGKNVGKREVVFRIGISTLSVLFAVFHAFFLICFAFYGIYSMIPVNLISIALYILIIAMNRNKVSGSSGMIFVVVPSAYALACVYLVGWSIGAQWFLLALIAPVYLIYEKFPTVERRLCVLLMIVTMLFLCYMVYIEHMPTYGDSTYAILEYGSIVLAMIVGIMAAEVLLFSSLFNHRRYQNKIANLTDEANRDPLTKMFNRRYIENMLTNLFWDENAVRERVFIATIDIDHFRAINDEHGHEAGDEILKKFAQEMLKGFRGTDIMARWGGESFLVVLNDTDERGALKALENFNNKLKYQATFLIDEVKKVELTVTMGFVSCSVDDSYSECIMRSNMALTYGKNSGRNLIVNYRDVPGAKSF